MVQHMNMRPWRRRMDGRAEGWIQLTQANADAHRLKISESTYYSSFAKWAESIYYRICIEYCSGLCQFCKEAGPSLHLTIDDKISFPSDDVQTRTGEYSVHRRLKSFNVYCSCIKIPVTMAMEELRKRLLGGKLFHYSFLTETGDQSRELQQGAKSIQNPHLSKSYLLKRILAQLKLC